MRKPWKSLLIVVALTVSLFAAGVVFFGSVRREETTHAAPAPDMLSALPAGAPTLVYIDLAGLRASSFYQHRPDKGPITVPDQNYSEFIRSTGFDFEKDLDAVVLASWPDSLGKDQKKTIVIADGRFDRAKIRDYAAHKGKIEREDGNEVFLFPTDNGVSWNSPTFLSDHRIAMVDGTSIAPVFDHGNGDSTSDPARERVARLAGAAAFLVSRVPAVPENLGSGKPQAAQFASLARSVQWITLAVRPEGDDLRVSLEGECATDTDARQLLAMLEVFRMFGQAALQSPKTSQSMDPAGLTVLENLLKSADFTTTAERVRVLIDVTPEIFSLKGTPKIK